jgi:hypothetical protein
METRALLLLCCVLTAGIIAAAVIAPESIPAVFRTGTTPVPAGTAATAAPLTPVPSDFPGRLDITSIPAGAAVWIDTDPAPSATTPASIPLSPITHPLMLRHPGYKDCVTSVAIPPGSTVSLSARLEPAPADLPGRQE